ncbi:MAG: cell division inhibitor SepF [Mycobacteriales bacterium]
MAGAMRKMGIYLGLVEDDERRGELAEYEEYEEYADAEVMPARRERIGERGGRAWEGSESQVDSRGFLGHEEGYREPVYRDVVDEPAYRITTLHPRSYNEARTIGEHFREGTPVIMNLTEMDDADAKRLVDFAAGLQFGLRGSIERVTNKVFLLSPQNVHVTAEDKARIAEGGFFNQS